MARSRIISILVSAVIFTTVALVVVRGISAFEERAFEAGRALLIAGSEHAQLELGGGGTDLPSLAKSFADDEEVSTSTRALSQLMSRAPPGSPTAARQKGNMSRLSKKLNERLTAMRSQGLPESGFDALSVLDEEGTVLVTDSAYFRSGSSLKFPDPEPDPDLETDGEPPTVAPVENPPVVGPAGVLPNTASDELVRAASNGDYARSTLIVGPKGKREVLWVGAAPIMFKGRLYGIVVLEQKLKSLPQPGGVSAILLIDGAVRMGEAPEGYDPSMLKDSGEPFLMVSKPASSLVPVVGELPVEPLFVGGRGVGIWANSFRVPGAQNALGYVLTDVTPLFSELGGFQVMTLMLMFFAWLVHVTMIVLNGRSIMVGVEQVSDFLGKFHQGSATETRLQERNLPSGLHRLARLVNKTVEQTPGAVAPIAGAPSLDDVFKAQGSASGGPDELAFDPLGDSGSLGVDEALQSALPEPAADDLSSVEDFDPFNATGEITPIGHIDDDSPEVVPDSDFQSLGAEDFAFGGGVAPDPLENATALAEPEEDEPPSALANGPAAGSAVADLFSRSGFENRLHPSDEASLEEGALEGSAGEENPIESHYRDVFEQFVAARESCGESTEDLTFTRFSIKLDKSREAVMNKHACNEVRFSVYVKNGKAALKATPM